MAGAQIYFLPSYHVSDAKRSVCESVLTCDRKVLVEA